MSASLVLLVGGVLVAAGALVERMVLRVAAAAGAVVLGAAAAAGGAPLAAGALLVAGAGASAAAGRHRMIALCGALVALLAVAGPSAASFATAPPTWLPLLELIAVATASAALVRGQVAAGGAGGSLWVAAGALIGTAAACCVLVVGLPTVFVSVAGGAHALAAVAGFSVGESVEVLARDVRAAAPGGVWFGVSALLAAVSASVGGLWPRAARAAAVVGGLWALVWIAWVVALATGALELGIDLTTVAQSSQPLGPGRGSSPGLYGDLDAIGLVGRGAGMIAAGAVVLAASLDAVSTRASTPTAAPLWQAAGLSATSWGLVALTDALGAAPDGYLMHPAGFSLAFAAVTAGAALLGAGSSRWAAGSLGALSGGLFVSMLIQIGGGA